MDAHPSPAPTAGRLGPATSVPARATPVAVGAADGRAAPAIDGRLPELVQAPGSAEAVAECLRGLAEAGAATAPIGGGTGLGLGSPPRAYDVALDLAALAGILEYNPADLTVTVGAGTRLAVLQRALAKDGQMLALDPPDAERATIGGILATNAGGPLRLKYGSARDLLIGVRVAEPAGTLTRSGGKVVKNVAGYDLHKLYIGSLGTLAVIVEASFRLHPIPERYGTLLARFPSIEAAQAATLHLLRSPYVPSQLALVPPSTALEELDPAGGTLLLARTEGFELAQRHHLGRVGDLLREAGGEVAEIETAREAAVWSAIGAFAGSTPPRSPLPGGSAPGAATSGTPAGGADATPAATAMGAGVGAATLVKLAVPPAETGAVVVALERAADRHGVAASALAQPGSGIVHAWLWGGPDPTAAAVRAGRAEAVARGGSLVIECAPVEVKAAVDVWGEIGPTLRLMQGLKRRYDPTGCLNPGRFIGGI